MPDKITCVFVHGWGMNSSIWEPLITSLPDSMNMIRVDLPGHGSMHARQYESLEETAHLLQSMIRQPAIWIGQSLGGQVIMQLALDYPQKVAALMLSATSPCFVQRQDWPCAVNEEVFDVFSQSLDKGAEAIVSSISRFIALQLQGSDNVRQHLRDIKQRVAGRGYASSASLINGLKTLKTCDLRAALNPIRCPVKWVFGQHDRLVPVDISNRVDELIADSNCVVIEGATHLPFVTHVNEYKRLLLELVSKVERK